jgi:hypothetical protein
VDAEEEIPDAFEDADPAIRRPGPQRVSPRFQIGDLEVVPGKLRGPAGSLAVPVAARGGAEALSGASVLDPAADASGRLQLRSGWPVGRRWTR